MKVYCLSPAKTLLPNFHVNRFTFSLFFCSFLHIFCTVNAEQCVNKAISCFPKQQTPFYPCVPPGFSYCCSVETQVHLLLHPSYTHVKEAQAPHVPAGLWQLEATSWWLSLHLPLFIRGAMLSLQMNKTYFLTPHAEQDSNFSLPPSAKLP